MQRGVIDAHSSSCTHETFFYSPGLKHAGFAREVATMIKMFIEKWYGVSFKIGNSVSSKIVSW